jgi:hypothetical protein
MPYPLSFFLAHLSEKRQKSCKFASMIAINLQNYTQGVPFFAGGDSEDYFFAHPEGMKYSSYFSTA